jgi:hypothetical protein
MTTAKVNPMIKAFPVKKIAHNKANVPRNSAK